MEENSIEVIDIDALLSGKATTSTVIGNLSNGIYGATSMIVGDQMIVLGGLQVSDKSSNPIVFAIDPVLNQTSVLASNITSLNFGLSNFILANGNGNALFLHDIKNFFFLPAIF